MKPQPNHTMTAKRKFAQQMRDHPTKAEAHLWQFLSNGQLGYKFRRQQILQGFIIDFYCPSARLGVEVDGSIHLEVETAAKDEACETTLAKKDVAILRFINDEVFDTPQRVLNLIRAECEHRQATLKQVFFDLKNSSKYSSSSSRREISVQNYGQFPVGPCIAPFSVQSISEEIAAQNVRAFTQKLAQLARQKKFPAEPDHRPIPERVNSQRWALQEWLKRKA